MSEINAPLDSPVSPVSAEEASLLEAGLLGLTADGYGAVSRQGSSAFSKSSGDSKTGKQEKKGKKAKKAVSDMLKTEMASERTFFKWFRTGLQIGAIGTFVFIALDKGEDTPGRFAVVAFAWLVGLLLVLNGVYAYYKRRAAIQRGDPDVAHDFLREHAPVIVVVSLVLVVGAGLVYALWTGQAPTKGVPAYWPQAPSGAAPPPATAGARTMKAGREPWRVQRLAVKGAALGMAGVL